MRRRLRVSLGVRLMVAIPTLAGHQTAAFAQCPQGYELQSQDSAHFFCKKQSPWELREDTAGTCAVQTADSFPKLGTLLSGHASARAACQAALALHDPSIPQPGKCYQYNTGTRQLCRDQNVPLP